MTLLRRSVNSCNLDEVKTNEYNQKLGYVVKESL